MVADGTEVRVESRKMTKCYKVSPEDFDRRETIYETPEEKLKSTIIKLGEVVSLGETFTSCSAYGVQPILSRMLLRNCRASLSRYMNNRL